MNIVCVQDAKEDKRYLMLPAFLPRYVTEGKTEVRSFPAWLSDEVYCMVLPFFNSLTLLGERLHLC